MSLSRFRQLVWLAAAASILILAAAGWSQLRLRAARVELDALASESSELASSNERLRRQLQSEAVERQNLRTQGTAVILGAASRTEVATATIFLDEARHLALLEVGNLLSEESCAYQLRILSSSAPLVLSFGVDSSGNAELLLEDLPAGIRGFRIESGADHRIVLSGTMH